MSLDPTFKEFLNECKERNLIVRVAVDSKEEFFFSI